MGRYRLARASALGYSGAFDSEPLNAKTMMAQSAVTAGECLNSMRSWQSGVLRRSPALRSLPPRCPRMARVLLVVKLVSMNAAALSNPVGSDIAATDATLLARLSRVALQLLHCRQQASIARTRLQRENMLFAEIETTLAADEFALAAFRRGGGNTDRVSIEILENTVFGGRGAAVLARREAARVANDLEPVLARLSRTIEGLDREEQVLQARLSPDAERLYQALRRRNIVPFVAELVDGACAECHLVVSTGSGGVLPKSPAFGRCQQCRRVLISRPPGGEQDA
jgi:hypothetical protein